MTGGEARKRLRALRRRRKRLRTSEERLAEDTAKELRETRGLVPVSEAAELAGIHRTTAHDYLKTSN